VGLELGVGVLGQRLGDRRQVGVTLVGLAGHHPFQGGLERPGHVLAHSAHGGRVVLQALGGGQQRRVALKRLLAGQGLVEDDAQAVLVGGAGDLLAADLLG
jgi:hypothetical protein